MKIDELNQVNGSILQCHVDPSDPETFVVGRLLYSFRDTFVLSQISPYGRWDGFAMYMLDDLTMLERETDYIRELERLLVLRHETEPTAPAKMSDGFSTILAYAKTCNKPVALELYKSGNRDVVGYISGLDDDFIRIDQLDESGKSDGTTFVRRCAISRAFCGDAALTCIELLSK